MSTKTIAHSTLWQIGSQAAMAVLSILTAKFVAIGLSKELAGYYNSAYGFLQIFAVIADFGLYAVAVREVSKVTGREREHVLGAFIALRALIVLLSLGTALAFVWLIPAWRGTPFPIGVTIAAFVPFFTLLAGMIRTVFQVHYQMKFVFVAETLQRVLTAVGMGAFIVMGIRLTTDVRVYEWFLLIGGIGALLLFLISAGYARRFMRVRPSLDMRLIRRFAALAAPYGIAYLLMAMYRQIDVVFISLLRPDFAIQNAYYGFAGRVEDMAYIIPTFLLNSTLPILSARLAAKQDTRSLLGKTLFILLVSGSVFAVFAILWSKPLTLLFATKAYLSTAGHPGSDTAFVLMGIPMFLNGLVLFSFYTFLARNAWSKLMLTFGFGVGLTVLMNLLWTPTRGFVGAATAMIVVHICLTLVLLPSTLKHTPVKLGVHQIAQWMTFAAATAVIASLAAPLLTSGLRTLIAGVAMLPVMALLAEVLGIRRFLTRAE